MQFAFVCSNFSVLRLAWACLDRYYAWKFVKYLKYVKYLKNVNFVNLSAGARGCFQKLFHRLRYLRFSRASWYQNNVIISNNSLHVPTYIYENTSIFGKIPENTTALCLCIIIAVCQFPCSGFISTDNLISMPFDNSFFSRGNWIVRGVYVLVKKSVSRYRITCQKIITNYSLFMKRLVLGIP